MREEAEKARDEDCEWIDAHNVQMQVLHTMMVDLFALQGRPLLEIPTPPP